MIAIPNTISYPSTVEPLISDPGLFLMNLFLSLVLTLKIVCNVTLAAARGLDLARGRQRDHCLGFSACNIIYSLAHSATGGLVLRSGQTTFDVIAN